MPDNGSSEDGGNCPIDRFCIHETERQTGWLTFTPIYSHKLSSAEPSSLFSTSSCRSAIKRITDIVPSCLNTCRLWSNHCLSCETQHLAALFVVKAFNRISYIHIHTERHTHTETVSHLCRCSEWYLWQRGLAHTSKQPKPAGLHGSICKLPPPTENTDLASWPDACLRVRGARRLSCPARCDSASEWEPTWQSSPCW